MRFPGRTEDPNLEKFPCRLYVVHEQVHVGHTCELVCNPLMTTAFWDGSEFEAVIF